MFKLKIFLLAATLMLSLSLLISCSNTQTDQTPTPQSPTPTVTSPTPNITSTEPDTTTEETDYYGKERTIKYTVDTKLGGTIKGETIQVVKGKQPSTEVEAIAAEGYEFSHWSDGSKEAKRSGDIVTENTTFYAYFIMKVDDITVPTVKIETIDEDWIRTKNYISATITVEGTKDGLYDGKFTTQIKGRGNSSWSGSADKDKYNSKNSYRLKLDEKQNFLGTGNSKNRDWVLNSCKFDVSLLRNWIGYEMGDMLSGIHHSANCTWAHVYLNGDYRGVYMVTDHTEVANDRIDIDDTVNSPDNGFFVELDMRGNHEGEEGIDYFYIDGYAVNESNPREWVIKSDLSKDPEMAKQQFEFIKNYIQKVNDTIENGSREEIEALVDINSFVDMFICSEFSKDVDVNTASFFMYKEAGGKLCLTWPWDYDFGFGTYGEAISSSNLVTDTSGGNQWFSKLIVQKWFAELVYNRMLEIETDVYHLINKTVAVGYKLTDAAEKNDEKWWVFGFKYHDYVSSQASRELAFYEDHLYFLEFWMLKRWDNMKFIVELYTTV